MSRPANPYDNAKVESFMKTLKQEEVNARTYANIDDARRQTGAFIETVYNARRLHSALATNLRPSSKPNSAGTRTAKQTRRTLSHSIKRVSPTGCSP